MMSRKLIFLSLLLLAQLGFALGLGLNSQRLETFNATEELLPFSASDSDQLVFSGADKSEMILLKQGDNWTIPARFGAPANGQKVAELLQGLLDIRRPWPVAENGATDSRFKVADDNFERRLSFKQGEKTLGTLLIGGSPGFRKVYARVAGEKDVYAIPFSSYQASLKPEDWLDKQQLQLDVKQINGLKLPSVRLARQGERLELVGLSDKEQADSQKVAELVGKLAHLKILDIVAKPEQPLANLVELRFSLTLQEGRVRNYQLLKGDKEGDLLLQISDQPYLYKVSSGLKAELLSYTRERLVKNVEVEDPSPNKGTGLPAAG